MAYKNKNISQVDLDILFQQQKSAYIKIELLNMNFQPIDEIQGAVISSNCSINAESDIRRTCSLSIHILNDKYLNISKDSKIWINARIDLYYGIVHIRTKEIVWYKMGRFAPVDFTYNFSESSRVLDLGVNDLISTINGDLGGNISALKTLIEYGKGNVISDVLIRTITQLGGIQKYKVGSIGSEFGNYEDDYTGLKPIYIPYDLEFPAKTTVFDIVKKLLEIYPCWEAFFDIDGVFIVQRIPTEDWEEITVPSYIMDQLNISEQITSSVKDIKNVTEVWGKCLESDYFSSTCTEDNNCYSISTDDKTFDYSDGITVGFTANIDCKNGQKISINNGDSYNIKYNSDINKYEPISKGMIKQNQSYVLKYKNKSFILLGQYQIHAIYKNTDKTNPFSVPSLQREVLDVKADGDYANIYSDELAYQRAMFDNYMTTTQQDTLSFQCIIIPWLDVNQIIEYTSSKYGKVVRMIVKKIDHDFEQGTMNVSGIMYHPYYPPHTI